MEQDRRLMAACFFLDCDVFGQLYAVIVRFECCGLGELHLGLLIIVNVWNWCVA